MKKLSLLFLLFVCCGQTNDTPVALLCKLPKKLSEVSGIQISKEAKSLYAIQDSGNGSFLYEIGFDGKKKREFAINANNTDWEDLASDDTGNLYIGDFGNNDNTRKDLAIIKINEADLKDDNTNIAISQKTTFSYPEQTDFPPPKKAKLFDCEAFIVSGDYFYLFTKNRSKSYDGTSLVYKIANAPGEQKAILLGQFKTCDNYNTCCITGAAFSSDKKKIVLLSHSKVFVFDSFSGDAFLQGKMTAYELHHYSQKEAICFKDNNKVLIVDEKTKKVGGNLYEVDLKNLKSEP